MNATTATDDERHYAAGVVPLVIGVTGHRDLVPDEVPQIRERVRSLFLSLRQRFPDRHLLILTPLAEGADRLIAEVALELGVAYTVVLPMPVELYRTDFETQASLDEFERLYAQAEGVLDLPIGPDTSPAQLVEHGTDRNRQYAQLGVFLCAHCHILLAIWDGKASVDVGGTAQVVYFHHYDVMAGYVGGGVSQQILADDDSDLVYHIVVSRQRKDGEPRADLKPLEAFWLTTDRATPRTDELPAKYADIFDRTSRFNIDVAKHAARILTQSYPLIDESSELKLPTSILQINRFFCAADWLAIYFQRRYIRALKVFHVLVFAMALMFLFYSNVTSNNALMIVFSTCLAIAYTINTIAARGKWHEKYLEYRTLAEGLRVQFYWSAAGVSKSGASKYSHDNFLQKQDVNLGWIRNVMRVAGIACDVAPYVDDAGLQLVLDEWVGDEAKRGQLRYYRRKSGEYLARSRRIADLGRVVGLLVMLLLGGAVFAPSELVRTVLFAILGVTLLIVSVREAYAFRVAEKEVVRQYEFMYRIFSNARKRLLDATSDQERRDILRILGEAAWDEHAEWILLHRERPLGKEQLWNVEG